MSKHKTVAEYMQCEVCQEDEKHVMAMLDNITTMAEGHLWYVVFNFVYHHAARDRETGGVCVFYGGAKYCVAEREKEGDDTLATLTSLVLGSYAKAKVAEVQSEPVRGSVH